MNTPSLGANALNLPANALDLLAAAGGALTPGHTAGQPSGPATGAGFLALIQQALGVSDAEPEATPPFVEPVETPAPAAHVAPHLDKLDERATPSSPTLAVCPPASPDASPDVEPLDTVAAQPPQGPPVEPEPKPAAEATPDKPQVVTTPPVLDPIYAAVMASFQDLPVSLPGPMHAQAPATKAQPATHAVPATPAVPGISPAVPATPALRAVPALSSAPTPAVEPVETEPQPITPRHHSPAPGAPSVSTGSTSVPETPTTSVPDAGPSASDAPSVPTGSASVPATPVAPPVATASTTVPTPSSTPALNPVSTQIVDRIAAQVQTNGTHRITIDLNPGDLGQVRVVMTVRDGAVHVRLAASERDTRSTLREGSNDLTTLLTAAGATETKVTIRELGASASPDFQFQGNSANGSSTGTTKDQHAGTRAQHHPATDGTTTPRSDAAGATGTRSSETGTSRRHTGLDVSM